MIAQVFHLDNAIAQFMNIPEELLTQVVTIGTHASLVLSRSSSMLVLMLVINWGTTLFHWGFGWVQGRLEERATRGIVEPSMDDFTWVHALNPEHVSWLKVWLPSLTAAPHLPAQWLLGLRPLLLTPERRLGSVDARLMLAVAPGARLGTHPR